MSQIKLIVSNPGNVGHQRGVGSPISQSWQNVGAVFHYCNFPWQNCDSRACSKYSWQVPTPPQACVNFPYANKFWKSVQQHGLLCIAEYLWVIISDSTNESTSVKLFAMHSGVAIINRFHRSSWGFLERRWDSQVNKSQTYKHVLWRCKPNSLASYAG